MASPLPPLSLKEKAHLNKSPEFAKLAIYAQSYWTLYLNADQRYLGRSYLWLNSKHRDFHQLDELSANEQHELFQLMRRFRKCVERLWRADSINCAWLGNEAGKHRGHGHMHLIPRYATPPKFLSRSFPDERYGKNYQPYTKLILEDADLFRIRDAIKAAW